MSTDTADRTVLGVSTASVSGRVLPFINAYSIGIGIFAQISGLTPSKFLAIGSDPDCSGAPKDGDTYRVQFV